MADDAAVFLAVPGRKPGTSSKVTSGMLNASQNRTNRAALTEASMSSVPARCAGWFATIPTRRPPSRAKPTTMFLANAAALRGTPRRPRQRGSGRACRRADSVTAARAYRALRLRDPADRPSAAAAHHRGCCSAETRAARGSAAGTRGRRATAKCATPLVSLWVFAPPSSSFVTSSCVTV